MSTEIAEVEQVDFITTELQKFNITDTTIAEWSDKFSVLTINGIEDKSGYEKVREARLFIKGRRVEVEKTSKLLKADALAFQRAVNEEEKRIVALLDPIETQLELKEQNFEAEKQKLRDELLRKEQERINARVALLMENGCSFNGEHYYIGESGVMSLTNVKEYTDRKFDLILDEVKLENIKIVEAKAEAERLQKEEAERLKAEREELLAIRIEQDKQAAKLKEQQDAINADRAKIENERIERENKIRQEAEQKQRAIELDKAREEAAKKAKADLIEKQRLETERKIEADRKAKLRADRLEALKPVKQKLLDFAIQLNAIEMPILNDSEAEEILKSAKVLLTKVSDFIIEKSETL